MKRIIKAMALGGVIGLALNQIISYTVSAVLHLGYFMAYIAGLPERVGGEMNAVLYQMLFFTLLGMGVGLYVVLLRQFRARGEKRLLLSVSTGVAAILPAAALAVRMFG